MVKHKDLLMIFGYVLLAYVSYAFLTHGIAAIKQNAGFIQLITGMGISSNIASILIILIGIVDILVSISLFVFKNKWIFLYAGVWPLAPAFAGLIVNNYFGWNYLIYTGLMVIVYWIFIEVGQKDSFFKNIKTNKD